MIAGSSFSEEGTVMGAGGILLTFAGVCVGASLIIALLFRFWPRYGSVEAAIARTDRMLDDMERASTEH
jgi:hypothetical protein